jgi:hypothetical protein
VLVFFFFNKIKGSFYTVSLLFRSRVWFRTLENRCESCLSLTNISVDGLESSSVKDGSPGSSVKAESTGGLGVTN